MLGKCKSPALQIFYLEDLLLLCYIHLSIGGYIVDQKHGISGVLKGKGRLSRNTGIALENSEGKIFYRTDNCLKLTLGVICRYYILYYLVGNLQIWFVADKLLTPELHPSLHYHGSRTVRHFKYLQYTGNCSYSIKILQFRIIKVLFNLRNRSQKTLGSVHIPYQLQRLDPPHHCRKNHPRKQHCVAQRHQRQMLRKTVLILLE